MLATLFLLLPFALGQARNCEWEGHCLGAVCGNFEDCDGDLICVGGKCSPQGVEQTCTWNGHCISAACQTNDDCSDELVCSDQRACVDSSTSKWPFWLEVSCYQSQAGEMRLQVNGEHYNIGRDNVMIQVFRQSDFVQVYGPQTVSAAKVNGKPAGSFQVQTPLPCPASVNDKLHVYAVDLFTGRFRDKIFPQAE